MDLVVKNGFNPENVVTGFIVFGLFPLGLLLIISNKSELY